MKRYIIAFLKLAVPLAIIVWLLASVERGQLDALRSRPKNWGLLAAAFAISFVAVCITFVRWYLLVSKLMAGVAVSILQVYAFLAICLLFGVDLPLRGLLFILPLLIVSGLMLGGLGMLLSSWIKQLENFAGIMNFVIFPMFFLSSALYPLWRMEESSELLYWICAVNPFTHAVEMLRFALYQQFNWAMAGLTLLALTIFVGGAIWAYDPTRGMLSRRPGGPGG